MALNKPVSVLISILCWVGLIGSSVNAEVTAINQSIEKALKYSPQLKALTHNHEAIRYDLKQSRGRYYPTVDVSLGYGVEQFSDSTTRQTGADPDEYDWDPRGDASIKMTQKVYDGGETSQEVSIQKALLESSDHNIIDATQAISLSAISAHLDVYRQRVLVALAEKNLNVHQQIYELLAEGERAGAGSIADVTQTQARLARAQSILFISKADLNRAVASYKRVVGVKPDKLEFASVPETMPRSLEEALEWTEQKNPELLAFNARLAEADARVALTQSAYKPKINIELSSGYNDQLEGDTSWQHTNDAMLVMRWNLFNGGQDKAKKHAAISRKYETHSNREDKVVELQEATTAAWANYVSLQSQKKAYQDAVAYSLKTFDAYLKQFNVSKRDLLDVLSAENDYFNSASQLVTVSVEEIIAACFILKLGGALKNPVLTGGRENPEDLIRLTQPMVLPINKQPNEDVVKALSDIQHANPDGSTPTRDDNVVPTSESEYEKNEKLSPLCSIEIGPCITSSKLKQANDILESHGLTANRIQGFGPVTFIRFLVGIYPNQDAQRQLEVLRQAIGSEFGFLLPNDGKLALYAGSYHDTRTANRFQKFFESNGIETTRVMAKINIAGTVLAIGPLDEKSAQTIIQKVSELGLHSKLSNARTEPAAMPAVSPHH